MSTALQNLANLGIADYHDPRFIRYSNSLFDFKEVKQEMDFIRDLSNYKGKINVKKFMEGIVLNINK